MCYGDHPMSRADKKSRDAVSERLRQQRRAQTAPPGYYTKAMIKEKVGLSEPAMRSILWHKIITSDTQSSGGYTLYSEKSVEKLINMKADGSLFRELRKLKAGALLDENSSTVVANYSDVQGVEVFELLGEGRSLEEIIVETRIHPLVVKRIREDYDDITGSIHIPRRVVDQLNAFEEKGLPGTFPVKDANAVLDFFQGYALVRACPTCSDRLASIYCTQCTIAQSEAAMFTSRPAQSVEAGPGQSADDAGSPHPPPRTPPGGTDGARPTRPQNGAPGSK